MNKKRILVLLSLMLMVLLIPFEVSAASGAPSMNNFQVEDRITKLYKNYRNTGFTNVGGVYGKPCPNNHSYHRENNCRYCNVCNVIKTRKVKNEYKSGVNYNNLPSHYGPGGASYILGSSCCGFTNYAGFYILSNGRNVKCKGVKKGTYSFSPGNRSKINSVARMGDMIRFDTRHSAIYLATSTRGVFVIDSNWCSANCVVKVHTVPWSAYSSITFTRGSKRISTVPKVNNLTASKSDSAVNLKWSAIAGADKYQIFRSTSKTKGYSKIATVAKATYQDKSAAKGKTYYYKVRALNEYTGYSQKRGIMMSGLYDYSSFSDIKAIAVK